jgi:ppGpp synthetase/RelA/SpoT-type nucleotidyltranferase
MHVHTHRQTDTSHTSTGTHRLKERVKEQISILETANLFKVIKNSATETVTDIKRFVILSYLQCFLICNNLKIIF